MDNKITIYYCGNPLVEKDALPFVIVPELEKRFSKLKFEHHDPSENLPIKKERGLNKMIIIDTIFDIDKTIVITNPEQLSTNDLYSPHDWDLAFNLKLLIKLGQLKSFLIIGVPPVGDKKIIIEEVASIIKKIIGK